MAGGSYENNARWMIKAVIISSIVFAGLFCFLFFVAPKIGTSSSSASSSSLSSSLSDDFISENETDIIEEVYGCGNPRFTVQQWTLVNLPIAMVIIIFFSFFQPRTKLWPGCCGGRPSVVYPVNLLDSYSNRLAFLCAFGITCLGILDLFTGNYYLEPNYDDIPKMVQGAVRTTISYVNVVAIGLVHYPIMVSLTVEKWIVSDIIGLLYTMEWSFQYFYSLVECPWNSTPEARVNNLIVLPIYACYVMLIILFIKRIRYNFDVKKKIRQGLEVEIHDYEEDFQKTHYYERVSYLFTPKEQWDNEHEEKKPGFCMKLFRKYYKNEPGFRFSRRIICTIGLSALCLYCVGILYEASSVFIEDWSKDTFCLNGTLYQYYEGLNRTDSFYRWKDVGDTIAYTFSPTAYSAMGTMIAYTLVFFIAYRRNTLRLWRGDRSFCPKEEFNNVTLVVSSLKYSGYHIAFVIWGFVLLHLTLWLIVFLFIYLLVLPLVNDEPNWVWSIIKNQWLTLLVYLVVYYSQVLNAKFIFLQYRGKELSIDNRRVFHNQVYFYLFLNVLIGLASCLYRIFKSVLFGLLLVGRIDRCLLMRGFELYDSGYKAYLGFLQLEVVHTHPVVVTFCHYLLKDLRDRNQKVLEFSEDEEVEIPVTKVRNPRPRTRWFLAFTLIRNQHLLLERFNSILEARQQERQTELEEQRKLQDAEFVKGAIKGFVVDKNVDGDEMKGDVDMELTSSTERGLVKEASGDDEDDGVGERKNTGRRDGMPSPLNSKNRDEIVIEEIKDEHKIVPSKTTPPDADISNELKTDTVSMSDTTSTLSVPKSFKASSSPPASSSQSPLPTTATSDTGSNDSEIQEHHTSSEKTSLISSDDLKNEVGESNPSTTLNMITDIDIYLPGTPTEADT